MPGSSIKGKLQIFEWLSDLKDIVNVLDVGPGWGTYTKLYRKKGQIWDAVEVYEPYIERFNLMDIYNQVYVVDIKDFIPEKEYDLIILGDILEHLPKEDAKKVLTNILSFSRFLLISLPLDEETGVELDNSYDYWGNVKEIHIARWSNFDFVNTLISIGFEIIGLKKFQEIAVCLVSKKKADGFLTERIVLWDLIKYKKLSFDSEFSIKKELQKLALESKRKTISLIKLILPRKILSFVKNIFSNLRSHR